MLCGIVVKAISMTQHMRMYCPKRKTIEYDTRMNRKVLTPPLPKAQFGNAIETFEDNVRERVKAPYLQVRWQEKTVPHKPRHATSIPGSSGDIQPATPRKTCAAPTPAFKEGCWGSCARCILCSRCRRRLCNGGCVGCRNCRKCKLWEYT